MTESQIYSVEATKAAFKRHGFTLIESDRSDLEGVLVVNQVSLIVLARTDADADAKWSDEELEPLARRANVAVFRVNDITAAQRKRVVAALAALPDSEFPVELPEG